MIVAAVGGAPVLSLLMLTHGVLSASVTGAVDAFTKRSWNCSRPLRLSGSERVETHLSPSFFARSPPLAKIHEMPLRQSWPPMKKPEKFLMWRGLPCATLVTAALNSSRVVGVLTPASFQTSLRMNR